MKIQLTSGEMLSCWNAAEEREQDSISRGLGDRRNIQRGPNYIQNQAASFMAEVAAAKYLNIQPQTGIGQMSNPDIKFSGVYIDVKTSMGRCQNLNIEPSKLQPDWYYFFVTGDCQKGEFDMAGYIRGSNVPQRGFKTDYGYSNRGLVWAIPVSGLSAFKNGG